MVVNFVFTLRGVVDLVVGNFHPCLEVKGFDSWGWDGDFSLFVGLRKRHRPPLIFYFIFEKKKLRFHLY